MKLLLLVLLACFPLVANAQSMRIDSMYADEERDQLLIYGDFGVAQGTVTIDSIDRPIVRWMTNWIRCEIPDTGVGSAGPVIVRSGANEGLPRLLSSVRCRIRVNSSLNDFSNNYHYSGYSTSEYTFGFRFDVRASSLNDVSPGYFITIFWYDYASNGGGSGHSSSASGEGMGSRIISSDTGSHSITTSINKLSDSTFLINFEQDSWFGYRFTSSNSGTFSGYAEGVNLSQCQLTIRANGQLALGDVKGKLRFEFSPSSRSFSDGSATLVESDVRFLPPLQSLQVREETESNLVQVYPNPVKDRFRLGGKENEAFNIDITGINGTSFIRLAEVRGNDEIDVSDLPSGVYVVSTSSGDRARLVKY